MSCIKLKHSNLYRHFCKLGEQAWGQKMPQNTSARSVGHAWIFCVTRITKNRDWIGGNPWRRGRYFWIVSSFCAFSTLFVIERKVQQWFFEVSVYSEHTNLVGHWLGCGPRHPWVRRKVALGWGIVHSQFLQVEIHKFTTKKELVALLQQQSANEEFVRSCRHHYIICIGCFGKLCKDFRDKL